MGIEVAEIHVAEMHMMNADIAAYRQAFLLRPAHELNAAGAGKTTNVNSRTRGSHELQNGRERDGLGERRNAGQAKARRDFAVVRYAALRQPGVLGAQPHRVAEGGRVL